MPNECLISITRGRNKGKLCREVNRTCRHKSIQCPNCGEDFSYKHTYTTHSRACMPDTELHKTTRTQTREAPNKHCRRPSSDQKVIRRKTYIIKKKSPPRSEMDSEILARIHTLEQQNRDLKDKVQKVEEQPRNINNIMVIGNDFFQELTAKIGKERAVEFLSSTATTGKPIDVIDKLYLEGKDPMDYPIACRNEDHFRYLSRDDKGGRKLVDDHGGNIIGVLMINRLQNAFLMAANELISKHVDGSIESNADVLRCVQNITTVDKNIIVYQLAEVTNNSNHPFFFDESECEMATTNTHVELG